MSRKKICIAALVLILGLAVMISSAAASPTLMPIQQLGKSIFFDTALSLNENQSCASCHAPEVGWTGPNEAINIHGGVYEGSIPGAFGDRKPPSSAYATLSPIFHLNKKGLFVGGNFWDGRATGEKLGNPAADQAQGPFLNPKEQALPMAADVVTKVCGAAYGDLFRSVWGDEACDPANANAAYDDIALAIAAYEGSPEVNAFSSKFDYVRRNMARLTQLERRGYVIFQTQGKCRLCHPSAGGRPLFTDFTFDNLGIPVNPENPVYSYNPGFVDQGLGRFLMGSGYPENVYAAEMGKHKAPTLRNVDLRPSPDFIKTFGHNGYFKSLEGVVHFYNTRDVLPECPGAYTEAQALAANCWPAPEVPENMNTTELGNLGLTPRQEAALVAFLRTLSDGYMP